MADDTKLTWELTSPFAFAQVLEYWVQQYCDVCGRGNMVCVYGQTISQSSLSTIKVWTNTRVPTVLPQQDKFQQLHNCWNGVFCASCGRGGFVLPPNPQQQITTEPTTVTVPVIAAMIGHVPKDVLHQILRDWVLSCCVGCGRKGKPDIRRTSNTPMPLSLVLDAWHGTHCRICGRGTVSCPFETPDVSTSVQTHCHTPSARPEVSNHHRPHQQQTSTPKRKSLVQQYKQRKTK